MIRFHLKRRFAPIVGQLFGDDDSPYGMLPAHLLAKYRSLNHVAFNAAPIGTGPFIFKRWLRGDRLEFVANPSYFMGKPGLARITVSFSSDENALVARLRAHEIDWLSDVSPTVLPLLHALPGVRIVTVAKNEWFGIGFQMRRHAGRDPHLRRAIAAAIDKNRLVHDLTFGTAVPATVDLPAFSWGHPRDVRAIGFDPAYARRELALAMHPLTPLVLAYDQSLGTTRAAALQVQSELHAAGIPIELHGYAPEVFLGSYADGGIEQAGTFDLFLARQIWGPDPDNSSEFMCAANPPGGYNLMRYCNPVMDRWQRVAIGTTDRAVRIRAYAHIESLVAGDLPIVPIWWPRGVHAIDAHLAGFAPSSLLTTWNAWQWRRLRREVVRGTR